MARTAGEVNRKKVHSYYDYSLLFLILFLVCFGLVMIYSTSSYNAQKFYGDAAYYLTRQALFAGAGILIMLFVSKIDYRLYTKKLPIIKLRPITILYFLCALLQTYVIIFGNEVKGAKRWIKLGSLGTFQPSELSKIAVILGTAFIVNLAPRKLIKYGAFTGITVYGPTFGINCCGELFNGINYWSNYSCNQFCSQ